MKLLTATAVLSSMLFTAIAEAKRPALEREYLSKYTELRHRHGVRAPGCNLITDRYNNRCAGQPSRKEVRDSTATLRRMLYVPPKKPAVTAEPGPSTSSTYTAPSAPAPPTSSSGVGNATVQCESGGDYQANTGNGYYGGWQFDSQTWDAYGDPAYSEANEAPPAVQDQAAASVPYDAWPNC